MHWLKYKKIYFTVSGVMILMGIISLILWGMNLGVDFTGGAILEYQTTKKVSTEQVTDEIEREGIGVTSITTTGDDTYLLKLEPISNQQKEKVAEVLTENHGDYQELKYEVVGPSVGPELIKKTLYAIAIAAGGILIWVAYQFKNLKFGVSAILAMLHDSFILIGSFSLLGYFFDAQVDFLFVTALLTTLSFSVHDTIVVFDRIREIQGKTRSDDLVSVSNQALTETMVRSLNNSFTIIFMLAALLLLGGTTVKWFAAALLIGTILGTYSSPFVAVPILVSWDNLVSWLKRIRRKK